MDETATDAGTPVDITTATTNVALPAPAAGEEVTVVPIHSPIDPTPQIQGVPLDNAPEPATKFSRPEGDENGSTLRGDLPVIQVAPTPTADPSFSNSRELANDEIAVGSGSNHAELISPPRGAP